MSPEARLAALMGSAVARTRPLHGGDLSAVTRADLADGRAVVVKTGPMVEIEARMLTRMRAAGAPVPEVLAVGGGLFCMEYLEETPASTAGWGALGAALKALHDTGRGNYGWEESYAFGTVPIPNAACGTWPEFWAERRLLPHLTALPGPLAQRVERLAACLPDHLPRHPPPAFLHGDLWSGNALFSGPRAYLIDPACYRGHAEVDLAMLELFGQPDPAFWDGYGRDEAGRMDRRPIYQLWPALVHLRLFGAGYQGLVSRCLDAAGV